MLKSTNSTDVVVETEGDVQLSCDAPEPEVAHAVRDANVLKKAKDLVSMFSAATFETVHTRLDAAEDLDAETALIVAEFESHASPIRRPVARVTSPIMMAAAASMDNDEERALLTELCQVFPDTDPQYGAAFIKHTSRKVIRRVINEMTNCHGDSSDDSDSSDDDDEMEINPASKHMVNNEPQGCSSRQSSDGHRMIFSTKGGSDSSLSIGGPGRAGAANRQGGGPSGRGVSGRGGQAGSSYSTQRSGGYSSAQKAQGSVTGGPQSLVPSTQQQTATAAMQQAPSSQVTNKMTAQPPSSSPLATTPQQPARGQRQSDGSQPCMHQEIPAGESDVMEPDVDPATGEHRCRICGNITSNRTSFLSHRLRKHGSIRNTLACPLMQCLVKSPTMDALRRHLHKAHSISDKAVKKTFGSENEFTLWKEELQKQSNAQFVRHNTVEDRHSGARNVGAEVLYCNRSGHQQMNHKEAETSDGKRKKAPQGKGSAKIDVSCPASISIKHLSSGRVEIEAFLLHVGHELDICFLPISSAARDKIKQKLLDGFAPDNIAQFIRKDAESTERDRMIGTRDVMDILRLQVPSVIGYFDKNDHVSIDLAVKHYSQQADESPIFFYRPRTEDSETFALGIQTPSQRQLLDQYAGNVVCLDTTHKPCQYEGYLLGTILVLDSTGAGQPVAWFLIKGESEAEMTPIFLALKQRHPNLRPAYFMTDCADSFWNSWKAVFDHTGTSRLWCKWHVWRAWSGHISKVAEEARRQEVRQMLKNLMQAPTKDAYDLLYYQCGLVWNRDSYIIVAKDKQSRPFGDYFDKEYGRKGHLWSTFGRLDCDISTNMHLESFHRTLKKRYLKRLCNRRIDYVAHILINKVAPDFAETLHRRIFMRGRSTTHLVRVSHDHSSAAYLLNSPTLIMESERTDDGQKSWLVTSEQGVEHYKVIRMHHSCADQCHVNCQFCHVCKELYTCSCPRFLARGRMPCKHVHAVHTLFDGSDETEQSDDDDEENGSAAVLDEPGISGEHELFSALDEGNDSDDTIDQHALAQQLAVQATTIACHLQRWQRLIAQCHSTVHLQEASTSANQIDFHLLQSINQLEAAVPSPMFIGQKIRKRKMSPQKVAPKLLPLEKKHKKSRRLTTAEKEALATVQDKLSTLSRVALPVCVVCDYNYDSLQRIAQKCPVCDFWRHVSCFHVCEM